MNDFSTTSRLAWAAAHGGMESPLVNEYKKPFIRRRLLETFLGGLRLCASDDIPPFVYILQILLFSVVPLITVLFILLEHNQFISLSGAIFVGGIIDFIYCLLLQLIAYFFRSQKSKTGDTTQVNIASDEEVLEFDSPLGPKTWSFLIREKKLKGGILIYSLVVGLVGGCCIYYIRPATVHHLSLPWAATLGFIIPGILTVAVGMWPLIGGSPPEPATFHQLSWSLPSLSRPAHMLTCILVHFITSSNSYITWLHPIDGMFHLIFATAPVLWLLGILPPIDAYILWFLEQWHVLVLGGSAMSSTRRLVAQVILGTLTLFITAVLPSFPAMMVFAACRGFLLSVDFGWTVSSLLSPRVSLLTGFSGKYQETQPESPGRQSLRRVTCQRETALVAPLFAAVAGISLAAHLPHLAWYRRVAALTAEATANGTSAATIDLPPRPALFQEPARAVLGVAVVVVTVTMLVINEAQKVYLLGLVRNPLFPACHRLHASSTTIHILTQMLHIGCPLLSLVMVHQLVAAEVHLQMAAPAQSFIHLLLTIPLARMLRQIWQFPHVSYIHLSLYYLVGLMGGQEGGRGGAWHTLLPPATPPATRILVLSLGYLWGGRVLTGLYTVLLFLLTPFTEKKQKSSINFFLLGFNLALLPVVVGVVVLSAVLSAPLLPVFTLPVFLLGFPRPLRFWSYPVGRASNSSCDSVYYEQLTPHIICTLHSLQQAGALGITEPGEHFLLRWEDRFIWVQILESGFTYQYYSVKGLELQETSCHTAEASRVDASFSQAFDRDDKVTNNINNGLLSSLFNPHAFHTLTPLTQLSAPCYSDTRNVLTGVIDSPDTLGIIKEYFHKALLYIIMDYVVNKPSSLLGSSRNANREGSANQSERKQAQANNRKREHLKNLPKVDNKSEYIFEGDSQFSRDMDSVRQYSGHSNRRPSHSSWNSQSGRGSRLAWVDDHNPVIIARTGDTPPPTSPGWNDEEDPLESDHEGTINLKNKSKSGKTSFPGLPNTRNSQEHTVSLENVTESDRQVHFIPGLMYDSSSDDEALYPRGRRKHPQGSKHRGMGSSTTKVNLRVLSHPEPSRALPIYESPLSAALAPPPDWITDLPYDQEVIDDVQDSFPHAWFKFLLNAFGNIYIEKLDPTLASNNNNNKNSTNSANPRGQSNSSNINNASASYRDQASGSSQSSSSTTNSSSSSSSGKPTGIDRETYVQRMQYDETLEESYRLLAGTCHLCLLGSESLLPSPSQVYRTFTGHLSWSTAIEWLAARPRLYEFALQAYRIGVKLALDHTLIGGMTGWAELQAALDDYTHNWYLGPDTDTPPTPAPADRPLLSSTPPRPLLSSVPSHPVLSPSLLYDDTGKPITWPEAVRMEIPNLFSLGYNVVKGVHTSHLLSLGDAGVWVGRLGGEAVRGLWASLVAELLYLTNDDDERYSIQAHPVLLRNLTIQAADPPLGYPIFSSSPLRLGPPWLSATYQRVQAGSGGGGGGGRDGY
ncbi:hypothetical protein Pcinc_027147 [Petrolisthes cinctipes]|uniref:Pecanex-like protein n=1 Tax=Petrolisthes cinctipes TaxID=88211 RepID=A0AAE1F539_PETCI|nr:hypothetical protein Pcinc_027147 [Petrolisthes cinctipes]